MGTFYDAQKHVLYKQNNQKQIKNREDKCTQFLVTFNADSSYTIAEDASMAATSISTRLQLEWQYGVDTLVVRALHWYAEGTRLETYDR